MSRARDPRDVALLGDLFDVPGAPVAIVERLRDALAALEHAPADRRESLRRDALRTVIASMRTAVADAGRVPPRIGAALSRVAERIHDELGGDLAFENAEAAA